MQLDRLAQAIDQFVQRPTLTDDGNLEALADIPTAATTDHRVNGFSRRRVAMGSVACPGLGGRAPGWPRPGTTIRAADLVHATRDSPEVVQAVCMVCRSVDTAAAHDVGQYRARVEMGQRQNDFAGSEAPTTTPATGPVCRAENFFMDGHVFNIHL